MMQILLSFGPWIAFWVIMPVNRIAGAFAALGVCVALNGYRIARHRAKLLDIGILTFFAFLAVASFFVSEAWMDRWAFMAGNISLVTIVLISLAIRKPFTLQFAREMVPREHWEQPLFVSINYVITWIWAAAMGCVASASILRAVFIDEIPRWVTWIVMVIVFTGAIVFTRRYPGYRVRKETGMGLADITAARG